MNRHNSSKETDASLNLTFDPQNPKYRFCCETLPARYGCWFVASLELVFLTILFINETVKYFSTDVGSLVKGEAKSLTGDGSLVANYDKSPAMMIVQGTILTITICFIICLVLGVEYEREKLVFSHMVFQVFRIISLVVTTIILIFALADEITRKSPEEDKTFALICILLCMLVIGIEVWLFTIVLSYYHFITEKSNFDAMKKFETEI